MGGLIQLVAYGEQDVVLTGNPTVTFFQAVYKRHTNFAMETIQQTTNGQIATAAITSNSRITVVLARNGDLAGEMYLELKSNTVSLGTNVYSGFSNVVGTLDGTAWMAERAISDVILSIGGQQIDKHYQRWWRLYSELYLDETNKIQYGKMTSNPNLSLGSASNNNGTVYLPLLFFFNRNPGLYLPLIALQYHEVRLDFDISQEFVSYFSPSYFNVWCNYVFLDQEERTMFAQKGHEYLIEQLQYTGASKLTGEITAVGASNATTTNTTFFPRVTYNHPVKELVWCITQNSSGAKQLWDFTDDASTPNQVIITPNVSNNITSNSYVPISYSTGTPVQRFGVTGNTSTQWIEDGNTAGTSYGPLESFKLIINGQDRMKAQAGKYFNQVQPYYHHTGNPYPGIYSYSFALKPEQHQPSGTCNFSRVDNSQVAVTLKTGIKQFSYLEMFAINYNVLRIQSGMGGLAFSN
jgi:hypothetical protein